MTTEHHSPFRTRTIGVRVTAEDYELLHSLAHFQGKCISEWCREVLLRVARNPEGSCFEQAMVGEMVALRTTVTEVIYYLASKSPLTLADMKAIWKQADESKRQKALELLRQVSGEERGIPPPQKG